ncbi:hypothetical protein D9Q98_003842 [Chlorella vulgaris]|uniref:FAD synthase n=1 Tax=Chlorella vulgaris TaxID=3077 RepID=A0A9D4YYG6_CHLVU|nr:hypothetical protein D9Q98_003842 [Chlorella vulgaris]
MTGPECALQGWCRPLTGRGQPAEGSSVSPSMDCGMAAAAAGAEELPAVVALGKFDALHKGHRALAAAAAQLGGAPWLVSFSGIAEVLGWPARLPLVAPCDRQRVLATWGLHCQGHVPRECAIPFAEVRNLSPEAFVQLMAEELQVAGVVVGSNYRFGYRAAGTAQLLQQLGPQHGMQVRVLSLVGLPVAAAEAGEAAAAAAEAAAAEAGAGRDEEYASRNGPQAAEVQPAEAVSSSRVRHALAAGDMEDAAECLGRRYRLVASLEAAPTPASGCGGQVLHLPATTVLNQPPGAGRYAVLASLAGSDTLQEVAPPREAVVTVDEAGLSLQGGGSSDFHLLRQPGARLLVLDFLSEA